jgi:hypothetical protein
VAGSVRFSGAGLDGVLESRWRSTRAAVRSAGFSSARLGGLSGLQWRPAGAERDGGMLGEDCEMAVCRVRTVRRRCTEQGR